MSTDLVNRPNGIGVIDELRQQFPEIPERTVKELLEVLLLFLCEKLE